MTNADLDLIVAMLIGLAVGTVLRLLYNISKNTQGLQKNSRLVGHEPTKDTGGDSGKPTGQ